MLKRKAYTTSTEIAAELEEIADKLGVPESSIVTLAIRQFLLNHRKEEAEKAIHQSPTKNLRVA